ncbi:MAG TPA: HlyD family efflux transporter periplasmic adaptor subunit [Bacillus bacterium]|nr:HlyD family efflux transporter periplasmic adaptor subunit [Bacillus sp. (in: firmicutes)]
MERKKSLIVILILIIGSGIGIGAYYWYQGAHYVKTEDARIAGTLYKVSPQISGEIENVYVEEGDVVQENQTLAEQNPANLDPSMINKAIIKSPINGTVVKVYSKKKEIASPSQPLALVMDMNSLYVSANIEETAINKIKEGQDVFVSLDLLGGKKLKGKVSKIGKATNSTFSLLPAINTSGNFNKVTQRIPIEVVIFKPADLELVPGTNVVLKIDIKS